MTFPLGFTKNSKWHLLLTQIPPIPYGLSIVWAKFQDCLKLHLGAFSCCRPHSKLAAFCVTQYVGKNSNSRCEMCYFQNPLKPTECWTFFLVGKGKNAIICPLFWRGYPGMPQTIQPPKTGLNVASPWIFVGFIPHPLECMCLTKASNVLDTSYSLWSN